MGAMSGSASTEIDAPIEAVWAIVQDVESAPAWQRGIDAMSAVERDDEGRPTLADSVTDLKVKPFASRLRFSYDAPTHLSWVQTQGDLKALTGSWRLQAVSDGRTRATYALDADPGALLSRFVKGALEEKLRAVLIEGRPAELRSRAEAAAVRAP